MSIKGNAFVKNVGILMSGTVIAQALTVLASPILSRLFTPEDFALHATFISVTGLLCIFSRGCLEQGLILPEDNKHASDLLLVCMIYCSFFSLLSPLILYILGKFITSFEVIVKNGLILWACVFIICNSLCEIIRYYFVRNKQFKTISSRTVVTSIITVTLNLLCGVYFYSNKVLITSTIIAQIVSLLLFIFVLIRIYKNSFRKLNLKRFFSLLNENNRFPIYIMPGQLLNALTGSLPILVLSSFYSQTEIGYYSFIYKIIHLPMTVIGTSVNQVFLQKISTVQNSKRKKYFVKMFCILLCIIIVPVIICCIFAPQLITLVFGKSWLPSANIARVLAIMFVLQFATTPITGPVFIVEKKQRLEFLMQIERLCLCIGAFLISLIFELQFIYTIFIFSISMSIFYLSTLFVSLVLLKNNN